MKETQLKGNFSEQGGQTFGAIINTMIVVVTQAKTS
jgi:hypothetical protein